MNFTTEVIPLDYILQHDLIMLLKSIEDLEQESIVKLFLTVPHSIHLKAEIMQHLLAQDEVRQFVKRAITCRYRSVIVLNHGSKSWPLFCRF